MDQDLRIGSGGEYMTLGLQPGPVFLMIENLAVEGDPDVGILVAHRLVSLCDVHDAEARIGQSNLVIVEYSLVVGTTVRE